MQLADLGDETCLGAANILYGLPGSWILEEADEIAGMSRLQDLADLALMLHSADARPLPGAWIENNERTLAWIDRHAGRWRDPNKDIVHGAFKSPSVHQNLEGEVQNGWRYQALLLKIIVVALSQGIQCQEPPLASIYPIFLHRVGPAEP